MSHGTDPRVSTEAGFSALHFLAAKKFDIKEEKLLQRVIKLFAEQGASINQKNRNHDTPLHLACSCDNSIVISVLLSHKANLNGYNSFGNTPLMIAISSNYSTTVKLLLEAKVDISSITPSFIASLPKISDEIIEILSENTSISIGQVSTDKASRATIALKNYEGIIEAAFLESSEKLKRSQSQDLVTLPQKINVLQEDCESLSNLSPELKKIWKNKFIQCCSVESNTKVHRIDQVGLLKFFEIFQVSILNCFDIDKVLKKISPTSLITFKEFLSNFGSALLLFSNHVVDDSNQDLALPLERVRSLPTAPASVGSILPPPSTPKKNSDELQELLQDSSVVRRSSIPLSSSHPSAKSNPQPIIELQQQPQQQQQPLLQLQSAPRARSSTITTLTRPVPVPKISKPLAPIQRPQFTAVRSTSDSETPLGSPNTDNLIIKKPPKQQQQKQEENGDNISLTEFADDACKVDMISKDSSAYQYFAQMYDRLLLQDNNNNNQLLSIKIFEEYFKDSFTSYNLLHTIIPTLMAQKDLEVQ